MEFDLKALIPILAFLVYIILNWNVVKNRFIILILTASGALLWTSGYLFNSDNNSWLIGLGFAVFILGVVVDSVRRFKNELQNK